MLLTVCTHIKTVVNIVTVAFFYYYFYNKVGWVWCMQRRNLEIIYTDTLFKHSSSTSMSSLHQVLLPLSAVSWWCCAELKFSDMLSTMEHQSWRYWAVSLAMWVFSFVLLNKVSLHQLLYSCNNWDPFSWVDQQVVRFEVSEDVSFCIRTRWWAPSVHWTMAVHKNKIAINLTNSIIEELLCY